MDICIPWRDSGPDRARVKDFIVAFYSALGNVILADSGPGEFNRSQARNNAAERATGDVLVFMDADAYVPLSQVAAAAALARESDVMVKPFTTAGYLTEAATTALLSTGAITRDWMNDTSDGFVGLSWAIRRDLFDELDGFDESFVGYGGEDNAFVAACDNLLGQTLFIPGYGYSLWHPAERHTSDMNVERVNRYYATTDWESYRALRLEN
jgi:glycosyltransferase involved in cell wall biosynthesis